MGVGQDNGSVASYKIFLAISLYFNFHKEG